MYQNKQAFTLIELLVVVLIIGILAAVALPQYKKSVIKSRYALLKPVVQNLRNAENIYYLSNGKYTNNYAELDIDLPAGGSHRDDLTAVNRFDFDWGWCQIGLPSYVIVFCVSRDRMEYGTFCSSPSQCNSYCQFRDSIDGVSDMRDKICQTETGKARPTTGDGKSYVY